MIVMLGLRSVRMSDDDSHYISLSREVSVYRDKLTGDILVAWTNSYTGEQSEVIMIMIIVMMMIITLLLRCSQWRMTQSMRSSILRWGTS